MKKIHGIATQENIVCASYRIFIIYFVTSISFFFFALVQHFINRDIMYPKHEMLEQKKKNRKKYEK